MTKIVVPDACVFNKLFLPEHDSHEAILFFSACTQSNMKLIVPELFKYEVLESIRSCNQPINKGLNLLSTMQAAILTINSPSHEVWLLAEEIAKTGHEKSGYPSMYDSIYHALAIQSGGIFLTADKRHYAKVKEYGHITLLEDWESIFIDGHTAKH